MAPAEKFICLNFVFVLCCVVATAEKVMRPHFKDCKFWSDDKHLSHKITYDEMDPHINFTWNVLKDLHDVDMHIETKFIQKKDPSYFTTTNSTINFCRIINWHTHSAIGGVIFNYLKSYGNIVEKCPIPKGKYFIHKFWYPEDVTLAKAPEIDFEIHISAYHLDANNERVLIMDDLIKGETQILNVDAKPGLLALLPTVG